MYRTDKIITVLKELNDIYFLPAIQREFVWKPPQVYQLFDSMMQGYPIGSFLFWKLDKGNKGQWDAYQFVRECRERGTHNPPAYLDTVTNPVLVLDGQQRLTALYVGLMGHMKKYVRTDLLPEDENAWEAQHLYLNLLSGPSNTPNSTVSDKFQFQFRSDPMDPVARGARKKYWFKVARISTCASDQAFDDLKRDEKVMAGNRLGKLSPHQADTIDNNLIWLYNRVWKEDYLAYYLVDVTDANRALEIFARANSGGTTLSKSDLLLSMVTARWERLNAREEIYQLVETINTKLPHRNRIDKDFILKCALALYVNRVEYDAASFTSDAMQLIASRWNQIKAVVEKGFRLANSFGMDSANLTSANAMIPVIYYLMKYPRLLVKGSDYFDIKNTHAIRTWLAYVMLAQRFSAHTDDVLRQARDVIRSQSASSEDFPLEAITGKSPEELRDGIVDRALKRTYNPLNSAGKQLTFLALTLLYDTQTDWSRREYSIDHIFPQSLFTTDSLSRAGVKSSDHGRYITASQSLGNLLLLPVRENTRKSDQQLADWIKLRTDDFKQTHHIPKDENLYRLDRFSDFIEQRTALIMTHLHNAFRPMSQDMPG